MNFGIHSGGEKLVNLGGELCKNMGKPQRSIPKFTSEKIVNLVEIH